MLNPPSAHGFAHRITRRESMQITAAGAVGWALLDATISRRADAFQPDDRLEPLNRFPRMVQEYFVERVRAAEEAILDAQAALKTKADAESYVASVQAKCRESFGPFPEKTPLNAKITGVVERDAYNIEKLIFESRPGFLVTANLYVPKGRKFPLPGVVGTCGHSTNGKAEKAYQSFAQGLARQGYVCLIYDPVSQGERLQYADENLKSKIGPGVGEHLYGGNQQFLVGEFLGAWRAWDGIRALDYLLTREEVDPRHVGVTGNSGGGTMTTWLCGVESRWSMAAPSCFVTTFRRNMENELPADTEQCPPRALALGLDHADFLAAMAPKPVIILAKERDYFDARGAEEAYARLKRLYQLLGAEENISLFVGPTYHGYSQENREAMYGWFNRVTGASDGNTEPQLTIEEDKTIECTTDGQVARLGSRPIFAFTREKSQALAAARPKLDADQFKQAVRDTLGLHDDFKAAELDAARKQAGPKTVVIGIIDEGTIDVEGLPTTDLKEVQQTLARLTSVQSKNRVVLLADPETNVAHVTAVLKLASDAGFSRVSLRAGGVQPAVPEYRILRTGQSRKYPQPYSVTYAVETEPGIQAIVYRLSNERIMSRPFRGKKRAVLYVSHHSADAELREEPLIGELLEQEKEAAFFTCDVRGIGDSRPDTCGIDSFLKPYGADYFYAIHSLMLDQPYVGQKTRDVLRVLDWLGSFGHEEVHLVARGWGALPATFAALLSDRVKQVTLKNALTSYAEVAESETYNWPLSSFLPNVLAKLDLPDCYRALESKKLRQIEPWGSAPVA